MSKGQVTAFIILGVVLVLIFALLFFVISPNETAATLTTDELQSDLDNIVTTRSIDSCIEDNSESFLTQLGMRGGLYMPQNISEMSVIYYMSNGQDTIPAVNEIEKQFEILLKGLFLECVNATFYRTDEIIYEVQSSPKVLINANQVFINPNYYISYELDGTVYEKESNFISISHPFGDMYDTAKQITESLLHDPDYVDYTFLSRFDQTVYFEELSENILFFTLKDVINQEEFVYSFVVEFES